MEIKNIRKYVGKQVYLILKNGFRYTATIPKKITGTFCITDKFGNEIEISCDYIAAIYKT